MLPEEFRNCQRCRLHEGCTQVVPGNGDRAARILFIGEAPGEDEDRKGKPFVGRAGRVLDRVLRDMGYQRYEVFVTNMVKHRPPENRIPMPDEIKACKVWLDMEIEEVQPDLIVCLGGTAASRYFPDKAPFGSVRALPGYVVVSAYHPSYVLRARRPAIREQIKRAIGMGEVLVTMRDEIGYPENLLKKGFLPLDTPPEGSP